MKWIPFSIIQLHLFIGTYLFSAIERECIPWPKVRETGLTQLKKAHCINTNSLSLICYSISLSIQVAQATSFEISSFQLSSMFKLSANSKPQSIWFTEVQLILSYSHNSFFQIFRTYSVLYFCLTTDRPLFQQTTHGNVQLMTSTTFWV